MDSAHAGLSAAEAEARRARHGPNVLPRPRRPGPALVYLQQFRNPLIYLLLAAAAVSLAIGELTDAAFIFGALQFNAVIGTIQEWRAASNAEALDRLVTSWVVVRRDGRKVRESSDALVPGDVVELESGNQVPADIRLLTARDLSVDQSALTGESLPVAKDAEAEVSRAAAVADRGNMLFAGTTVLRGRAAGVVVATASGTEIGRIARSLAAPDEAPPPLVVQLQRLTRTIAVAMMAAIVLLGGALLLTGVPLVDIFFLAVALAVAAIPEGLPVAITVTLAIATRRMARRNVIVRSLPAVEGLGACTVIASDKTGTLTRNELMIRKVVLPNGGRFTVSGEGYRPVGEVTGGSGAAPQPEAEDALLRLAEAGVLCNEGSLRADDDGIHHLGDTVDVAFLAFAAKLGVDRDAIDQQWPQEGLIPFEPQRRFAASFNRTDGAVRCFVKGAAEVVLPMCDGADRAAVLAAMETLAGEGYRVLAVAAGDVEQAIPAEPALKGLDFLGLVGLIDPVRAEVPDAVRRCQRAGIGVRMVTGDHPVTALAISRELGIAERAEDVVTGDSLSAPEGMEAARQGRSFARVEPLQKLDIVRALQEDGEFVAVTGDGVNDAPALRAANIGVAMGQSGTDVARDASDLILADDNFASIVGGVEEGRIAQDNVRKVVWLLISTGAAEIMLFFLTLFAGLPLPLLAVQLLWLNIVTQGIQGVALAFERGEPGILDRRPRPPDQPIFDRRMIEQVVLSGAVMAATAFGFYWWALEQGMSEDAARNAVLLLMVLFENVHVLNCRSERRSILAPAFRSNPWVVLAILAAQAAHLAVMYVPGVFSDILHTAPASADVWIRVGLIALTLVAIMEAYKWLRRNTG